MDPWTYINISPMGDKILYYLDCDLGTFGYVNKKGWWAPGVNFEFADAF